MAAESSDGLGGRSGERWRNNTSLTWYRGVSSNGTENRRKPLHSRAK